MEHMKQIMQCMIVIYLINIGARFDDRITGKIDEFSPKSKKVHIDIDPSSINKIIKVDLAIVGDVNEVITATN